MTIKNIFKNLKSRKNEKETIIVIHEMGIGPSVTITTWLDEQGRVEEYEYWKYRDDTNVIEANKKLTKINVWQKSPRLEAMRAES